MIAGNHTLHPKDEVSLGILNSMSTVENVDFMNGVLQKTKQPVKSFRIGQTGQRSSENERASSASKTIEYVFEDAHEAVENVSKYAAKSNVNLMFANRTDTSIKNLVDKLNVSILLN